MVSNALQNAIDSLQIKDVYILDLVSTIQDGYQPKYDPEANNLVIQFKHVVLESKIVELGSVTSILQVRIDLGVRWVVEDKEDADEKAKIEAGFVTEYTINNELSEESIEEFSLKNASYHVWPYWRELVANVSERMRLPRVIMPTVQFATNNSKHSEDCSNT